MPPGFAAEPLEGRRPPPFDLVVESARLFALDTYRVLGRRDFAPLAQLAQHAAESFAVGRAAVTFVDAQHVWFAGSCGFGTPGVLRDSSFCDVVVRRGAGLLVGDAQGDARFRRHELVRIADGVRSYAGVPLIDEDGYVLGTIGLFAHDAEAFDLDVLVDLERLAQVVQAFLTRLRADAVAASRAPERLQGWLGVRTLPADRQGSRRAGRPRPGLVVLSVARRSPAESAGLRPADVLYAIDGRVLCQPADVVAALADRERGAKVRVSYRRGTQWRECVVAIEPQSDSSISPAQA